MPLRTPIMLEKLTPEIEKWSVLIEIFCDNSVWKLKNGRLLSSSPAYLGLTEDAHYLGNLLNTFQRKLVMSW